MKNLNRNYLQRLCDLSHSHPYLAQELISNHLYSRSNSTLARKENNLLVGDFRLPKLNQSRNNKRISSTVNALQLFFSLFENQIDSRMLGLLNKLSYTLSVLYNDNPDEFVSICKSHLNWVKTNCVSKDRSQGLIEDKHWNGIIRIPKLLTDVFIELTRTIPENRPIIIRLLCSLLSIYEVVTVPKYPKFNTITDAGTYDRGFIDSFPVARCAESLGLSLESISMDHISNIDNLKWHTSSASGPNGQALWMAHIDAKAVFTDPELREHLSKYCDAESIELLDKLEDSFRLPNFFKVKEATPKHSKLHLIFEKGDKCRVIAIVDYWTQQALCPLHNTLANILKGISNDGTFDQDKVKNIVRGFTSNPKSELFSLDLSAATDRLPLVLQKRIIDHTLGRDGFGDLWGNLITQRSFHSPDGNEYRYSVGQPMGTKSSFPMLALTHHFIVQAAALECGLNSFDDYVIIGDDIVINSRVVAESYMNIMRKLGMDISLPKSIISTPSTTELPIAELAKTVYLNGSCLSPLPTKLLATVIENGDLAYQLWEELGKRELIFNHQDLFDFFAGILNEPNFKFLLTLCGLPKEMTGMKFSVPNIRYPNLNHNNFKEIYGITSKQMIEFYYYSILVEQLKRADTILKNTTDIYTTITKAAAVSKTVGIGFSEKGYMPVEDFSEDDLSDWEIVETFHPAVEAVKNEVDRINYVLVQLMSPHISVKHVLLSGLVDQLRISTYETMPDTDFAQAKVTRKLIEQTFRCISSASHNDRKEQTFTIKLSRLNLLWFVKVSIFTPCTISRTYSRVSSFMDEAKIKSNSYLGKISGESLIPKVK